MYTAAAPSLSPLSLWLTGTGGWVGRALKDFRVILLDQRGTGKSSAITTASLARFTAQEQASYLTNFRADSIVEDAEAIRAALLPETAAGVPGKWTLLGQSFGGFCLLTYLSRYSEALEAALFTGGLAPLATPAATVYRATYKRCAERNRCFELHTMRYCLNCLLARFYYSSTRVLDSHEIATTHHLMIELAAQASHVHTVCTVTPTQAGSHQVRYAFAMLAFTFIGATMHAILGM
jgi:pimeloyl-ACP methyl ester carboxylesterase